MIEEHVGQHVLWRAIQHHALHSMNFGLVYDFNYAEYSRNIMLSQVELMLWKKPCHAAKKWIAANVKEDVLTSFWTDVEQEVTTTVMTDLLSCFCSEDVMTS